jgi:PAS domain S-box-containing protein
MKPYLKIIHVEDSEPDRELVEGMLEAHFNAEIKNVQTNEELKTALADPNVALILSDFSLPNYSGSAALALARKEAPHIPFLFFSGTMGEEAAIEMLTSGATDYVLKHRPQKLVRAIERAIREREERQSRINAEEALRAQEEWFRALSQNALDIVSVIDAEGVIKYNSPSISRVLGYAPEELHNTSGFDLIHPREIPGAINLLKRIVEHPGETLTSTFRVRHSNGDWRQMEILGKSLTAGAFNGVVINSRDVTARNEAESRYRTVFENALEGICQIEWNGRFITANRALAQSLGYNSSDELLKDRQALGLTETELNAISDKANKDGFVENFQCEVRKKDGSPIWLELNLAAVRGETQIAYYNCFAQDITRRITDEAEIRQQNALLNAAHDAIILTDALGQIRKWNKGAEQLYGWTDEEVIGRLAEDVIFGAGNRWPEDSTRILLATGKWDGELSNCAKDGRHLIVMSRRTVLRGSDGAAQAFLILNSDVTRQRAAEDKLLRAQRVETLGAIAGGVAHDLNNVLVPVVMCAEMLKADVTKPASLKLLETILTSGRRGADITRQILSFARGTGGGSREIDLGLLIEEIVGMIRRTFPKRIEVTTAVQPGLPSLVGNPTDIHQILMNLCVNARDAMPDGGTLQVAVSHQDMVVEQGSQTRGRTGSFIRLTVGDSGTGIPPEMREKIFEPFFSTKSAEKGTGLGLATVLSIVERLEGFLDVESALGKGTTFHIYLPLAQQPGSDDLANEVTPLTETRSAPQPEPLSSTSV